MKNTKAEIVAKATELFGTREEAVAWLDRPAMALDQKSPASLLRTATGRRTVGNLLIQLEHGVYV